MSNLIPAIMRTGVPIIYAILIKLGVSRLGLPDAVVTDVATVLLSVLLYAALRGLEAVEPKLGVLLGWVGQPQYANAAESSVAGVVVDVRDQVETAARTALEHLRDDVLGAVESKIASTVKSEVASTAPLLAEAVATKVSTAATKKPAAKKTTTKKTTMPVAKKKA